LPERSGGTWAVTNDILDGGRGGDYIQGDGGAFLEGSVGGKDRILGQSGNDWLVGDAQFVGDPTTQQTGPIEGGDDWIEGGTGNDQIWGDFVEIRPGFVTAGGNDTFVFTKHSGVDTIFDFEDGKDRVDVRSYSFDTIDDLIITNNGTSAVTVAFDANDRVFVQALDGNPITLTVTDFFFA